MLVFAAKGAVAAPCDNRIAEAAQAARALSGDTIELADGRQVRLAAVIAPGRALSAEPQAAIEAARAALNSLVAGKRIGLNVVNPSDRHGRILAHVALMGSSDVLSTEAALLASGSARLLPPGGGCSSGLRQNEEIARNGGLGLWSEPYYSVAAARQGAAFSGRSGDLVLAAGRVTSVNSSGSRLYLNFAERWQEGLSVTVWKGHLGNFIGGESALRALKGSRVRVRGWLTGGSPGPLLAISGPAQIEWLETEQAADGE